MRDNEYKIKKYLGDDLKSLACLYGINAANSRCPCIWCTFDVAENSQVNQPWKEIKQAIILLADHTKSVIEKKAYKMTPIIDFIDC